MRTETCLMAHHVIRAAARAGLEAEPLYELAGVRPEDAADFERRIDVERLFALWEHVMHALDRPSFPIDAAMIPTRDSKSPLHFLCRSSQNMREAARHAVRYARAASDDHSLRLEETAETFTFVFDDARFARLGERCNIEFHVATFAHSSSIVTGGRASALRATFRHRAPKDTSAHLARFNEVLFEAPRVSIAYPARDADVPLPAAVPGLAAYLERHLASLVARVSPSASDTARVRAVIVDEIRQGRAPSRARTARNLGVSLRTLNRRLAEEDTTFYRLVDAIRRELAEELLSARTHYVKEIAAVLGFGNVRSFHRAYRRWTGRTPRAGD